MCQAAAHGVRRVGGLGLLGAPHYGATDRGMTQRWKRSPLTAAVLAEWGISGGEVGIVGPWGCPSPACRAVPEGTEGLAVPVGPEDFRICFYGDNLLSSVRYGQSHAGRFFSRHPSFGG